MDQNIAELLEDAFSEIDISFDLQSEEDTNISQIPLVLDEDIEDVMGANKLWTSEQGSVQTFTNVYEQEEGEASSDNSESESSTLLSINTESTLCLSLKIDNDQVVNTMIAEAQQLNDTAGECTEEEGNMQTDLEAGVSEKELTEEEHIEALNVEYVPQTSSAMSSESQTPEETSFEPDEELPENYSTTEQSSQYESVDNKDKHFPAMSPNTAVKYYVKDDMKEFTEEDQEQIEESLADYPSDLSHSETEEPAENVTAQPFTLIDISSSDDHSTDRMEEFSNAENVNKDSPDPDYDFVIKGLEVEPISASANVALSFQRESSDEEDVQESLTNDINTEENAKNKEDAGDVNDLNDQEDNISDSSSDDHSSSQEETNFLSSVNQKEEENHVTPHNYSTEDMLRMDNDIGYISKNTGDLDAIGPEEKDVGRLLSCDEERGFTNTSSISYYEESNRKLHRSIELDQSDPAIKDHDVSSSEASDNVEDTKNVITEALWSSSLLMDEDNLHIEEYDWDLSEEDSFPISSGEGENQEYTEESLEELDDEEGNERDWELEKTRIEAFYRFYGDQAEPEDKAGRNYKVTFRLDQKSSSSECEEDSDSTEEEPDSDLNTPNLNTLKPEYHSESDDDTLEKPYYLERSKMQPKEQQPVNAPVNQPLHRNKCLAVLKSTLAFGLLTAIGIVSFWWATENIDWIH